MLQEAVQRIQITGVLPSRQQVIIGAQIATIGTRIEVRQNGNFLERTWYRVDPADVAWFRAEIDRLFSTVTPCLSARPDRGRT